MDDSSSEGVRVVVMEIVGDSESAMSGNCTQTYSQGPIGESTTVYYSGVHIHGWRLTLLVEVARVNNNKIESK